MTSRAKTSTRKRAAVDTAAGSAPRIVVQLFGLLMLLSACMPSFAAAPTISLASAPLVDPTQAWQSFYSSSTAHTPGVAAASTTAAEIVALARALGADHLNSAQYTQRVFDYVRLNVETEFRFGLGKGARGALLDLSGTPFDQAALMVELLRQQSSGMTITYQVGPVVLTANEFGLWTGLVDNLTQSAQTFNVNAQAACALFADGGIPVSCSATSGLLNTITFLHVWVSVNGSAYDPSYKRHILKTGIDLPAAMGCGTATAATCGGTLNTQGTSGPSYASGTVAGASYVQNINRAAINTQLSTYAQNLESNIKSTDRFAQLEDVAGGSTIDVSYSPTVGFSLPYTTVQPTPFGMWTAANGIPDKFRTTLGVSMYGMVSPTLYLDELYGQRMRIGTDGSADSWTRTTKLLIEERVIATGTATVMNGALDIVSIGINHPYAASAAGGSALDGTYADETAPLYAGYDGRNSSRQYQIGNQTTVPLDYTNVITVVTALGRTGRGYQQLMTALQATHPYQVLTSGGVAVAAPLHEPHPSEAAGILVQQSYATRLLEGVTKTKFSPHHTLGVAFGLGIDLSVSGMFNITAMVSGANASTNATTNSADRAAAFKTYSLMFSSLEGSAAQQTEDGWEAISASSLLRYANDDQERFLSVDSTNIGTASAYLASAGHDYNTSRVTNIQALVAAGYQLVLPDKSGPPCVSMSGGAFCLGAGGEIISRTNELGYSIAERLKGDASIPQEDPLKGAMDATKLGTYSLRDRKAYSVNPVDGTVSFSPPPDLTVGSGSYPGALAFKRTYSSADSAQAQCVWSPSGPSLTCERNAPGNYQTTLPNGWHHNLQIAAEWANNGLEAQGVTSAIRASSTLSTLYSVFDLSRTASLSRQLTGAMAAYWLTSSYMKNSFVIHLTEKTLVFVKLPDGSYDSPIDEPSAQIVSNESRNGPFVIGTSVYYDYAPTTLQYRSAAGDSMTFSWNSASMITILNTYVLARPSFDIQDWTTPSGVNVHWTYVNYDNYAGLRKRVLTQVSNNLGHTLTINGNTPSDTITSVADEAGRTVSFATSNCGPAPYPSSNSNAIILEPGMVMEDCRGTFSVTLPDGQITSYSYAADSSSPDPTDLTYPNLRLRKWFTPSSSVPYLTIKYDSLLHVATTVDGLGTSNVYTAAISDEPDRLGELQDAAGGVSRKYADLHGKPLIEIDPLGRTTAHFYDNARRLKQTILPEGNGYTYAYDVRSNLLSTTQFAPTSSALPSVVTSHTTYMEGPTVATCVQQVTCNRPFQSYDSLNRVTTYGWDPVTGLMASVQKPAVSYSGFNQNPLTSFGYTAFGSPSFYLLTSETEFGGLPCQSGCSAVNIVKRYAYNPSNKYALQSVTEDYGALNLITAVTFSAAGDVSSVTDPNANQTFYTFDLRHRQTSVSAPLGVFTRYCYDVDGQLVSTNRARLGGSTDPNQSTQSTTGLCAGAYPSGSWQSTTRSYFSTGEVRTETDAEGNVTQYAYDPTGRTRVVQDGDGRQTATAYDAAGQVVATWRGGGGWIDPTTGLPSSTAPPPTLTFTPSSYTGSGPIRYAAYGYFPNGERQFETDADGNTTTYSYDGYQRLTSALYADTRHTDFWYTVDGTATGANCGNANWQSCRKTMRSGNYVNYTYDALDRQLTRSPQLEAGYTFGYDLRDQVVSVSKGASGSLPAHTTTYVYDNAKRKTYETNDGRQVQSLYDGNGNRTYLYWPDGYYVRYFYDALNRMTYAYQNGSTEIAYYAYDTLSRRDSVCLGGQSANCAVGGGTNKYSYGYEPDGDLSSLTQIMAGATVAFGYGHNHSHQITGLSSSDSYYLPIRPISTESYTPQVMNQYSAFAGNTLSYDLNGNLKTLFPTSGAETFTYDSENRLVSAAVNGSGANSIFYDYDARERRVTKTVGGTALGVGGTITTFLLDGQDELAELDGSANVLRRYIPGPGVDDRIAVAEGASNTAPTLTYFHVNHQGSVIAMTDAVGNANSCAAGVNCQTLAYDEYGNLSAASSGTGAAYRFSGRRFDPETGLYYYRARYYTPQLGRFMQFDPIGSKDDLNLYAYVYNDPVDRTDPSGLWTCDMVHQESRCMQVAAGLGRARAAEANMTNRLQRARMQEVLKLWGKFGDKGVNVKFASGMDHPADTTLAADQKSVDVTVSTDSLDHTNANQRASIIVAHEGEHGVDILAIAKTGDYARLSSQSDIMNRERKAYRLQSYVDEALGNISFLWSPGMRQNQREGRIETNAYESYVSDCAAWNKVPCTAP